MSFFLLLISPTLAALILVARLVESLESLKSLESLLFLCCFYFLFFLALIENLEFWVEMDIGVLKALELFLQFIATWVLTLYTMVWADQFSWR